MTAGFMSSAKFSFKCINISLLLVWTQSLLVPDLAGTLCCHRCCLSAAPPLADFFIHMTRGQTSGQQGGAQTPWTFYPEQSAGRHWTVIFHTWVTPASPDWILSSYICTLVLKAQLNWQIIHLQHHRGQECTTSVVRCSVPMDRSYRLN